MKRLLLDRNAVLYLTGQTVSGFGDAALWLVAAVWVVQMTGSVGLGGLTFFFLTAPSIVAPLAGLLIDRVPRRPLLVVGNLASAAVVLLLLLVRDREDVWLLYLVMTLYGLSSVVLGSAQSALLPALLPSEQLGRANALLRSAREALRLVAPPVGTLVFVAYGGGAVALLDAASFAVAAVALMLVRPGRAVVDSTPREHVLRELAAGFRHIAATPVIRRSTIALAVILLVVGFLESAGLGVITEGLDRPAAFIGIVQAVQGAGAIAGGLSALRALPRIGETALTAFGAIGLGLGCAMWVLPATLPTVFAGSVLMGAGLPWLIVGAETLVQLRTPDRLLGRTFGAVEVSTALPQTLSIAVGAALIATVPYEYLVAAVALVTIATGIWLYRSRRTTSPQPATS